MKLAFIGHFAPLSRALESASSAAGNQVQRQIVDEISHHCGTEGAVCYSMAPMPAWPRGPLIASSLTEGSIEFIGYLNLPALKHIVFGARVLKRLLMRRPPLCLQYNSYVAENLSLLLFRAWCRGSALAIIIQDIHVLPQASLLSKRGLRSLSERTSLRLAKRFDMIVPVSPSIVADFHFAPSKCFIFQGGITDFAAQLMVDAAEPRLAEIGVIAGALEPHNGIDRLVDEWLAAGIEQPLHVFGRGSLTKHVEQAARVSDRIVFHGFQPEHVVLEWQRKARWNFCLRYSIGLNQAYFFPSKLFNILCAPGAVVANNFHALPASVREHLWIVADDLSNLAQCLSASTTLTRPDRVRARREAVQSMHSWRSCIARIIQSQRPVSNA